MDKIELALFMSLSLAVCCPAADINVAGVFESRDVCRAATLALAEVALVSRS